MGSNEQPEPSERAITIRLSPENIILAAAILFLLAAVLLAVFFSLDNQSQQSQRPTAGPVGGTSGALPSASNVTAGRSTASSGVYPGPGAATTVGAPTPATGLIAALPTVAPQATFVSQPYPGPNEPGSSSLQPTALPTAVGSNQAIPSATSDVFVPTVALPTFAPSRPTSAPPVAVTSAPIAPTVASTSAPIPTVAPISPTFAPPTATPRPVQPTSEPPVADAPPTDVPTPRPAPTAAPPSPIPADVVRGALRWSANQSPIIVRRDLRIAPGSSLTIDPGVEVRVAPGAAIYVEGKLYAAGQPGKPVRFTSTGGGRWDAIYGRPGGDIGLSNVEISGGGNGGTLISSEGGNLTIARAQIRDNGGQIRVIDSRFELRESDLSGNDLPYGAAVEASYTGGGGVVLVGNRIGGNRLSDGASSVLIRNESTGETLNLNAEGNLIENAIGPDMTVFTNGPLRGGLSCNALVGGSAGLMVKSTSLQVAPQVQLTVANNAIENQTPPIIPEFLKYGIGRGASSDLYIDMQNNWWRSELGPYHPDLHADGRGEAVGANITFAPWLTTRPACAPMP